MLARSMIIASLAAGTALLAGCADTPSLFGNSANLTTASVAAPTTAAIKTDPACAGLASQIDGLRKEGVADKIEKAAQKKYKMTTAELSKADQLNKLNVDFQGKCSNFKPTMAAVTPAPTTAAAAVATAKAAPAAGKDAANSAMAIKEAASTAATVAKP